MPSKFSINTLKEIKCDNEKEEIIHEKILNNYNEMLFQIEKYSTFTK